MAGRVRWMTRSRRGTGAFAACSAAAYLSTQADTDGGAETSLSEPSLSVRGSGLLTARITIVRAFAGESVDAMDAALCGAAFGLCATGVCRPDDRVFECARTEPLQTGWAKAAEAGPFAVWRWIGDFTFSDTVSMPGAAKSGFGFGDAPDPRLHFEATGWWFACRVARHFLYPPTTMDCHSREFHGTPHKLHVESARIYFCEESCQANPAGQKGRLMK
jgi:hypothetical protein